MARRRGGVLPPELRPPDCPEEVKYLWKYFENLNGRRTFSDRGPNSITHTDLWAWQQNYGVKLSPFELDVIDALESLYLDIRTSNSTTKKDTTQ